MTIYFSIQAICTGDATRNCILAIEQITLDKFNFAKQDLLMFEQKSLWYDCFTRLDRASKEANPKTVLDLSSCAVTVKVRLSMIFAVS